MSQDLRFRNEKQKELRTKKEDEELVGMMCGWAKAKGRIEKEISRKFESGKYGNQFPEESMKDREGKTEDLVKIEKVNFI